VVSVRRVREGGVMSALRFRRVERGCYQLATKAGARPVLLRIAKMRRGGWFGEIRASGAWPHPLLFTGSYDTLEEAKTGLLRALEEL